MNDDLIKKANAMFYRLTKDAARYSFIEYLEDAGLTLDEWEKIKSEITSKTKIEFKYK
jgi:tRNA A37 threonylcarbamoyladenosine biosynthesis protein TsaE